MEQKERVNNLKVNESTFKKISSFILTTTLILSLNTPVKGEVTNCNTGAYEYHQRIYEYQKDRQYDENLIRLYKDGELCIDGESYPISKFFITITTTPNGYELHLMNVRSDYNDILTNSLEVYNYDNIIKFRDTTAFIELINSDCVLIDYEKNIITIIDKEKALEIINNWDGMIHNKVPETDAVENKSFIKR